MDWLKSHKLAGISFQWLFQAEIVTLICVAVDWSLAATIKCNSTSTSEFLYLVNHTCLPCPDTCTTCVQSTYDLEHPCISCHADLAFHPSTHLSLYFIENGTFRQEVVSSEGLPVIGGDCVVCSGKDRELTLGPTRVRLSRTFSVRAESYLEGRLEVFLSGHWSGVCDDGWNMINTHVACRELGLGVGLAFFSTYDMLHPNLPQLPMAMDNVRCDLDESSVLKCKMALSREANCITNETIGIRCSGPETRKRCLKQCPVGQYLNFKSQTCYPCQDTCLECLARADYCFACQNEQFATIDGDCYVTCPYGKYGNSYSGTCEACGPRCIGCMDGPTDDVCLDCKQEYTFNNFSCTYDCPVHKVLFINGTRTEGRYTCLPECPIGYLDQTGICAACTDMCKTCAGRTDNCTSCKEEEVLQVQLQNAKIAQKLYKCQISCDTGYYPNPNKVCQQCRDPHCVQCYIGGTYCQICKTGYKLEFSKCVKSCSKGLLDSNGICRAGCPEGFYKNFEYDRCDACSAPCAKCSSSDVCSGCHTGFHLKGHRCVQDCGPDMVSLGHPPPPDVQLVGGRNSLQGRVEVLYQGVWGYICGTNWTLESANVVCRQLQLGTASKAVGDNTLEPGGLAIASHVICQGNETSLWNCDHDIPSMGYTCDSEVAGVYCRGPDRSKLQECRMLNQVPCDENPCFEHVTCTDLRLRTGSRSAMTGVKNYASYCGNCPPGMAGDGTDCTEDLGVPEPSIEYPSQELTVLEGWPEGLGVSLPCVTQHPQMLAYTWYRNDQEVRDPVLTRLEGDGSLTLVNPVGEDASGFYKCVVSNGRENDSVSYLLMVQEKIRIIRPPNSYAGGPPVILTCGHTGFPRARITWHIDGKLIDPDTNPGFLAIADDGSLVISRTSGLDSGDYSCELSNGFTSAVAVAEVSFRAPASILGKREQVIAQLGHNFTLPCVAAGSPAPKVFWKRALEEVGQYDRIEAFGHILHIYEVEYNDSDHYQCVAANSLGPPDVWTSHILVMDFPEASASPLSQEVSIGDNVTISCQATGNPSPQITWYLPSRGLVVPANNTGPHQVEWSAAGVTLRDIQEEDSGPVQCRATNPAGTATASVQIRVKVPPRFSTAPRTERFLAGYPALVPWSVEGVPEPMVSWRKGSRELDTGPDFNITGAGLLFVPQYPASRGTYTLQATNSEGLLNGTGQLDILPVYSPPGVIEKTPTNITLDLGGIYQVRGDFYVVVVIRLGVNGSQERQLNQSPLDVFTTVVNETVEYDVDNDSGYVTVVFYDSLPLLAMVGDEESYWDNNTQTMVHNVPLSPGEWYAIFVKVMSYDADDVTVLIPVSATHYLVVFTEYSVPEEPGRLAGWAVGLLATCLALLVVAGAGAALVLAYWRREGRCPCDPVRSLHRFRKSILQRIEGPLDVEAVLGQFSPHPSPTRLHNRGLLDTSASSSGSTLYIPTEDEIDRLEEIGIDYYDDDDWLSRVPDGVLGVTRERLEQLKKHAEEEEKRLQKLRLEKECLTRTSSHPSLYMNSGSDQSRAHSRASRTNSVPSEAHATGSLTILEAAAIIKPPESRLLHYLPDGLVSSSELGDDEPNNDMTEPGFVNQGFDGTADEEASTQHDTDPESKAHVPVGQRMSSISKRSDSGFESDRFQNNISKHKKQDQDFPLPSREWSTFSHRSNIMNGTSKRGRHHSDTDFETLALLGSPPSRRSYMESSVSFRMSAEYKDVAKHAKLQRRHSSLTSQKSEKNPELSPGFDSFILSRKLPEIPHEAMQETSFTLPRKRNTGGTSAIKSKKPKSLIAYNPNYIDYLLSEHARESGAEDSGLESDQFLLQKKSPTLERSADTRQSPLRTGSASEEEGDGTDKHQVRRKLSMHYPGTNPPRDIVGMMDFQSSISDPPKSPSLSVVSKQQKQKERKRRKRGQRLSHLRAKGAEFFSRGKRWARNMLEWHEKPGEHIERAETSSTSSNTEEDDLHDDFGRSRRPHGSPRTRREQQLPETEPRPRLTSIVSMTDLESSYIDPSTIMSVPETTTRMQELQEHDPVWSAKLKVAQNVMQAKHAFVRKFEQAKVRRMSQDVQGLVMPLGKNEESLGIVPPRTTLENTIPELGGINDPPMRKDQYTIGMEIDETVKHNVDVKVDGNDVTLPSTSDQEIIAHIPESEHPRTDEIYTGSILENIVKDLLKEMVDTICRIEQKSPIGTSVPSEVSKSATPTVLHVDKHRNTEAEPCIDELTTDIALELPTESESKLSDSALDNSICQPLSLCEEHVHHSRDKDADRTCENNADEPLNDMTDGIQDVDGNSICASDHTYMSLLEECEAEERHCAVCNEEHRPIWEALTQEEQEVILRGDFPPELPPRPPDLAQPSTDGDFPDDAPQVKQTTDNAIERDQGDSEHADRTVDGKHTNKSDIDTDKELASEEGGRELTKQKSSTNVDAEFGLIPVDVSIRGMSGSSSGSDNEVIAEEVDGNIAAGDSPTSEPDGSGPVVNNGLIEHNSASEASHDEDCHRGGEDGDGLAADGSPEAVPDIEQSVNTSFSVLPNSRKLLKPKKLVIPDAFVKV